MKRFGAFGKLEVGLFETWTSRLYGLVSSCVNEK